MALGGPYTHWLRPSARESGPPDVPHDWVERTHMRPRTLGKIVVATLTVIALIMAFLGALASPSETGEMYRALRGITYGSMALTFATLYRYFED